MISAISCSARWRQCWCSLLYWWELVRRYQGRLQAFAESRLKGHSDAEDVVQETFIALIKILKTYRGQASLETYRFSIIRRKIIDGHRSQAARRVCLLQDIADQRISDSGSSDLLQHLQRLQDAADQEPVRQRILQSTIGFLHKP